MKTPPRRKYYILIILLLLVTTACGAGNAGTNGEGNEASLLPSAEEMEPLPAAVVEVSPMPGSRLPLTGSVSFIFNQRMDRPSVEAAINGEPTLSGTFTWVDDRTVSFAPASAWLPDTEINFIVSESAKAENGLSMLEPARFTFKSADYLEAIQKLPEPGGSEGSPASSILASFNQPVVNLGANGDGQPVAFTLNPPVAGQGEWLNTSTYIYYPDSSLSGGVSYSVSINPELESLGGAPLASASDAWTFTTDYPQVISNSLENYSYAVPMDVNPRIVFNTSMNPAEVEDSFSLVGADAQNIEGEFEWSEKNTVVTFVPRSELNRASLYHLKIGQFLDDSFYTFSDMGVASHYPGRNEYSDPNGSFSITFTSKLKDNIDYSDYISIVPEPDGLEVFAQQDYQWNVFNKLRISAFFQPNTEYAVTIAPDLVDKWDQEINQGQTILFKTGSYKPNLSRHFYYQGMWVDPVNPVMTAQAVNISSVNLMTGTLSLYKLLEFEKSYWNVDDYLPGNLATWSYQLSLPSNQVQEVSIPLTPDGSSWETGIYWLKASTPDIDEPYLSPSYAIASHVSLLMKSSEQDVSVWAIDRRDQSPVSGEEVKVYDLEGNIIAQGVTDSEGLFYSETIYDPENRYYQIVVVMAEPGEEYFSYTSSDWSSYYSEFGGYSGSEAPLKSYVYTERPIYRPGDTIHFRAILRNEADARYSLPDISSVNVKINYDYSKVLDETEVQLSEFGSAVGSFTLPADAPTGYYWIEVDLSNCKIDCSLGGTNVPVAAYVKPSVDLQTNILNEDAKPGDDLVADTSIEFFFGQDAGGMNIEYRWYSYDASFNIPGYRVGPIDTRYGFNPYYSRGYEEHDRGVAEVDQEGNLELTLPVEAIDRARRYYFSVNLNEEGEQMIGAEDSVFVHPSDYYIGIRGESRVGQVDETLQFDVMVVNWDLEAVGPKTMSAKVFEVAWEPVYTEFGIDGSEPVYTEIADMNIEVDSDGLSATTFTPTKPGIYMVEVSDGEALSQTMIWVNGPGRVTWQNVQYNRIELEKDKESYLPGDTAEIFIPNTFVGPAQALISIERDHILYQEIIDVEGNGLIYKYKLEDLAAPNVYLSVSMVGLHEDGWLTLGQGRVNLPVDPFKNELSLEIIGEPERSAPGEEVAVSFRVTDYEGNPVEGEFSIAVVDKAIFALADSAEQDIFTAFYDQKRHGVRTGGSLLVSTEKDEKVAADAGGIGGGGGDAVPPLRNDFQDTAYWAGQVITNQNGEAEISVLMPDNLTTWKILVRGTTLDTKVGEAEIEILTTKELIVRPVTPRFLVFGDHLEMGAFIHNNSDSKLQIGVALQTVGFVLDDPNTALQEVIISAGDREWVSWWGSVEDVEMVEMTFAAQGGGLTDVTTPALGGIPVLRYLAAQTFATSGLMEEGGERLEVISLPPSVDSDQGSLNVSLATSLAGAILPGLEALEVNPYESIEATVSRFLPNLEAYRAVQEFGLEVPELESNLSRNLEDALFKLTASQNYDGGWAWTTGRDSNPTLSAYAFLGWVRAKEIGMAINEDAYSSAAEYLLSYLIENMNNEAGREEYDRGAFVYYVLSLSGEVDMAGLPVLEILRNKLYENRAFLNPWGQALFALALRETNLTDPYSQEIFSDLKSTAIRSSTGVHWEETLPSYSNLSSALVNTSMVLYSLASEDPSSPLVADAVRYLVAHRDVYGAWTSNYATAWSTLALVEVMKGTGELGGEFAYSANLNSHEIASGQAGGTNQFTAVSAEVGIENLLLEDPNALKIQRDPGTGRLYYSAALQVSQPVETVAPLSRGLLIERIYTDPTVDCDLQTCVSLHEGNKQEFIDVTLNLTVPNDLYYVVVEDFVPAGSEILNTSLNTYNYYYDPDVSYDPYSPYSDGWGWWHFDNPKIYDDHIYWLADFLPAGNYQLSYTIVLMQSGEFQVIPAHAEQLYFPEVQANSAGEKFVILP